MGDSPGDGTNQATMALYPRNTSSQELHRCVTLGARQHDLSLSAMRAQYKLIQGVAAKVEGVAAGMASVAADTVAIKTALANREFNVKKLSAWLIFFASVLATSASILTNIIMRPSPVIPQYAPLTAAQQAQWDKDHPRR